MDEREKPTKEGQHEPPQTNISPERLSELLREWGYTPQRIREQAAKQGEISWADGEELWLANIAEGIQDDGTWHPDYRGIIAEFISTAEEGRAGGYNEADTIEDLREWFHQMMDYDPTEEESC